LNLTWDSNLRNRLIVGFIGGPVLVAFALYGHYLFLALIAVILFCSLHEMHLMGRAFGAEGQDILSYLYGGAFLAACYFDKVGYLYLITIVYLTVLLLKSLWRDRNNQLMIISFNCLTTLYVSLFLGALVLVREFPYEFGYLTGGKFIVAVFLGVWSLDTFAYFTGRMFGRRKLLPSVSPKKTVEGSIGGMIGCVIIMVAAQQIFLPEISLENIIILSMIIGVTGQIGDLIESYIKRKSGIKDSSSLLPGHGGILDRFDSMIFVSPFIYYYIKLVAV